VIFFFGRGEAFEDGYLGVLVEPKWFLEAGQIFRVFVANTKVVGLFGNVERLATDL